MLMKNPTDTIVIVRLKHGAVEQFVVNPGETIEIDDKFALPRLASNGSRRSPVVEEVAPQLVPANEEDLATWNSAPAYQEPQKPGTYIPTVEQLTRLGTPRGIAIKMVEQALASESEKLKVYQEAELLKIKEAVKEKKAK